MFASLILALLVILSGTVATYLYDENAPFGARVCSGAALGLAALGLVSFLVASFLGLTGAAIVFSAAICCSPLGVLADAGTLKRVREDLESVNKSIRRFFYHPDATSAGYLLFYAAATVVLWKVFSRAVIEDETGLSTGLLNNFGDLPFHLSPSGRVNIHVRHDGQNMCWVPPRSPPTTDSPRVTAKPSVGMAALSE